MDAEEPLEPSGPPPSADDVDGSTDARGSGAVRGAAVYATTVDLADENDSHTLVVQLVGRDKRVLELGCATGSVTKVLRDHGCHVTAVEIDPDAAQLAKEWAEEVIVGDLDTLDLREALGGAIFDVIVAADVLEHLKSPSSCLQACLEHLAPEGEVVISIPNIAHVDVRMSLLRGDFEYQDCGILDQTHLRFFTRRSLEAFLDENRLVALEWRRTVRAPGKTEIWWRPPAEPAVVEWASAQPDAETYQFVLRAAVGAEGSHLAEIAAQRDAAAAQLAELGFRLTASETETDRLQAHLVEAERRRDAGEALNQELQASRAHELEQHAQVVRERDEYVAAFNTLAGVQEELVAVRRSESFRLGRAMLSPLVTSRRVVRAWKRAKR